MTLDSRGRMVEVEVYDKALARVGWASSYAKLEATLRHNGIGAMSMVFDQSDPKLSLLTAQGARVVARLSDTGEQVFSGPVRSWSGSRRDRQITVTAEDDLRLLWRLLAWPNPAGVLDATPRTLSPAYASYTGSSESVLKQVVAANMGRLERPLTVAPNLDRGPAVMQTFRFHPVADRMLPWLDSHGLGVSVRQQGSVLVLDVYEPQVFPVALTEASGVVQDWSVSRESPSATRVIVGGRGEGSARYFVQQVAADREANWGDMVEVFADARNSEDNTSLVKDAAQAIADGEMKSGLSVSLSETQTFRYGGGGVHVGDLVTINVGVGIAVTDVLREVKLAATPEQGLVITPSVGDQVGGILGQLARAVSRLGQSRRNQATT